MENRNVGSELDDDVGPAGFRDAFHAPCVIARSVVTLKRAEFVRLLDDKCELVGPADCVGADGIVDPFLPADYDGRGPFWVFLLPGKAKKLIHSFEIDGKPSLAELQLEKIEAALEEKEYQEQCRGCW